MTQPVRDHVCWHHKMLQQFILFVEAPTFYLILILRCVLWFKYLLIHVVSALKSIQSSAICCFISVLHTCIIDDIIDGKYD